MNALAPSTTIPASLIAKYNVPGPRYTSYPTALRFCPLGEEGVPAVPGDEPVTTPIALYVHIPFCASLCRYCGCSQVISDRRGDTTLYLDHLEREIALWRHRIGGSVRVAQLHFGGGTPSHLSPLEIDRLSAMIRGAFIIEPDAEISVEIDPRRLDRDRVLAFRRLGCRRASLGVQDFNPRVQKIIGRIQTFEQTAEAMRWLREAGFESVNLDLIYGLPYQTPETIEATMDRVLELDADRLAVFSYAHIPWIKPAQKILERTGELPGAEEKVALFSRIFERLTDAGYAAIGLDHFAKQDDELAVAFREGRLHRNFQGYSTRPELTMIGLGVTSISQSRDAFHQNEKELLPYYKAVNAGKLPVAKSLVLSDEDRRRALIIRTLMCAMKLDFRALSQAMNLTFTDAYAPELARLRPLAADGLIRITPDAVVVTETGRFFLRNIAMIFDEYLEGAPHRYSKTV